MMPRVAHVGVELQWLAMTRLIFPHQLQFDAIRRWLPIRNPLRAR